MELSITNVHLDLGAGRRGTDMGPSAMHVAGLVPRLKRLGHMVRDVHSLDVTSHEVELSGDPTARFLDAIREVSRRLADRVERTCDAGQFPLVLGGDHSQAIGTISGLARHHQRQGQRVGVLWIDAHTDMNTPETSPSGNIHGMPLAALLGFGLHDLSNLVEGGPALDPSRVVIFGARDIDPTEVSLVQQTGVRVYTMTEIDVRGASACLAEALEIVTDDTAGVHLSFDLDGVDPQHAPGVGTPVVGGLSLREAHLVCELVNQTGKLLSMEMVELNPTLDLRNQTGELAVWLIQSALGKRILPST